jgi:restriction endonuclease S subunit
MEKKLKYISSIRYGVHHSPIHSGEVMYLQTKHFDSLGRLDVVDSYLQLEANIGKVLLEDGDILLPAKGNRHFAWVYRSRYGLAVASSIFFVIKPQDMILPDYLAAILNLPQNIIHFQKLSGGNTIPSFSKKELEEVDVPMIPLSMQEKIVEIDHVYTKELVLLDTLKEKIIVRFKSLIAQIAQQNSTINQ